MQVMGFSAEAVATFIAVVGVLSVFAQTAVLGKEKPIQRFFFYPWFSKEIKRFFFLFDR